MITLKLILCLIVGMIIAEIIWRIFKLEKLVKYIFNKIINLFEK